MRLTVNTMLPALSAAAIVPAVNWTELPNIVALRAESAVRLLFMDRAVLAELGDTSLTPHGRAVGSPEVEQLTAGLENL